MIILKTTRRCIDLDIGLDIVNKIAKKYNLSLLITSKKDEE